MENKPGKLSKKDLEYIKEHRDDPPEEIAKHLRRNVETIKNYIGKTKISIVRKDDTDEIEIIGRLTGRKDWVSLQKQFTPDELEIFKEHWVKQYKQFNYDVLPTEELQMINAIRLEILVNRNMEERNKAMQQIADIELEIVALEKKLKDEDDDEERSDLIAKIGDAKDLLGTCQMSMNSRTSEFEKFTTKLQASYKDLKSTRDQRYKELHDSSKNFIDWLKLLDSPEFLEKEGKDLALRQIAAHKEYDRLKGIHTYLDGKIDQPLLTPETVSDE